jgi:predicted CoA-substrate-specific enzyme activase
MYTLGIDIGSASSKVVILKDGIDVVASSVVQFGTGSSGPKRALELALGQAKLSAADISLIVATGYGRNSSEWAEHQVSEISCHARGIYFLMPEAHSIIDIGGQDAKAIRLGVGGIVVQFVMNEKCAAGTGRFLEVMARVLEVKLEEMELWHDKAVVPAAISSTCTVFAESEVISQLSMETPKADIIAGVHVSVATRACGLLRRIGVEPLVVMSGGVAQNSGVVKAISKELGTDVKVAPDPQIVGALGASLYAYDYAKAK